MRAPSHAAAGLLLIACGGSEPDQATVEPEVVTLDLASMSEAEQRTALMKLGETVYKTGGARGLACQTCHQEDGKGVPRAFPPLVGQKGHMGDCRRHASIVLYGLRGQIEVDGLIYNGVMTPQGELLTDLEIAAVITYERLSWGNDYGLCLPEAVAAARRGK